MYKAKFRTAYDQREIPVSAVVVAGDPLEVGQVVTVDFYQDGLAVVEAVSANTVGEAKELGTHIIAQSDQTMEYGHIPVEDRDYRYNPEVKASIDGVDPLANFDGFYDSLDAATTELGNGTSGHTILVKLNGKYTKYTSNGSTWSNSNVIAEIKKVALFAIVENDVIVYDDEA